LYNDGMAKKNCAACPALRTGARRLRATLLPFALASLVTERARSMRTARYLVDALTRVQDHPTSAIDELLSGAWSRRSR
jgi:hypothetical protein